MKRFLALFLAVSIGLQSFTAVGESSSLVGDSAVLNEQAGEKGISSGEATALTRESGDDNGEESKAEEVPKQRQVPREKQENLRKLLRLKAGKRMSRKDFQ